MTERTSSGFVSGGVATQDAASHPEWYLLNTSGQRFTSRYFNWVWIADVGSASYQQQWADNVLGEIAAGGWDGVFMDDTNPTMSWHYDVNRIAKYPTDAAWQAATRSALVSIGARFRAAGKLVDPELLQPEVLPGRHQGLDGARRRRHERAVPEVGDDDQTGPETYDPTDYWELQLKQMKEAEAAGKYYLGITPSTATDRNAARYGFATMLLAGGGQAAVRAAQRLHQRALVRRVRLRDRHPRRRRDQGRRAASTSASSPTASSTSTRRRAPSASTSAAPTRAPACRTRPRPPATTKRPGARQGR